MSGVLAVVFRQQLVICITQQITWPWMEQVQSYHSTGQGLFT